VDRLLHEGTGFKSQFVGYPDSGGWRFGGLESGERCEQQGDEERECVFHVVVCRTDFSRCIFANGIGSKQGVCWKTMESGFSAKMENTSTFKPLPFGAGAAGS